MEPDELLNYAKLSNFAYFSSDITRSTFDAISDYQFIINDEQLSSVPGWYNYASGFNGFCAYSPGRGEMVVAIAGSNFWNPVDFLQDFEVGIEGTATAQSNLALALQIECAQELAASSQAVSQTTFVGHSLGGTVSAVVKNLVAGARAVIFNAPGRGGVVGELIDQFANDPSIVQVYAETWGSSAVIHGLGVP